MVSQEYLDYVKDNLKVVDGRLVDKKTGRVVGGATPQGYRRFSVLGVSQLEHRVVYYLHYGIWPGELNVDHINGVKGDNRPENLRLVDHKTNRRSFSKIKPNGTSRFRGVTWFTRGGKWGAWKVSISDEGVRHHLGYFYCEKEAALAYNHMAEALGYNPEAYNQVF